MQDKQLEQVVQSILPNGRYLPPYTRPLKGGISAPMTAFAVEQPDGQLVQYVLRQPYDGAVRPQLPLAEYEFRVLQILPEIGVNVPTAVALDTSRTILPTPYYIMSYINGQPNYAPADVADYMQQVVTQQAKLHQIALTDDQRAFLIPLAERLQKRFWQRPRQLDHSLREGKIRAIIESLRPVPNLNPSVLLHGDLWVGNFLWQDNQLLAVVDWEETVVGDPLYGLAVSRMEIVMMFGLPAMEAFTQQYHALTQFDLTYLPYWDLLVALRPALNLHEWASGWADLGRPDVTELVLRTAHQQFVAQAFARIPDILP